MKKESTSLKRAIPVDERADAVSKINDTLLKVEQSRPITWVKENPLSAIALAVGAGFLGAPLIRRLWKPALLLAMEVATPQIDRITGSVITTLKSTLQGSGDTAEE